MVYLILGGFLAGLINSIAGGGIFVVLPMMLMAGATGKQANASSSFAVWVGQFTSLRSNSKYLPKNRRLLYQLVGFGLAGSSLGALLLVITPNVNFEHALPYLNLAATSLFLIGPWLKKQRSHKRAPKYVFPLFILTISIYGGYFGGGLGILLLATLGLTAIQDIKEQNAIKLLVASTLNFVSTAVLFIAGLVVWEWALPAGAGALLGGYVGGRYSEKLAPRTMRWLIVLIGSATTVYLFRKF